MPKLTYLLCVLVIVTLTLAEGQKPSTSSENAALRYWQAFAVMQDLPTSDADAWKLQSILDGSSPWDEGKFGVLIDRNQEALAILDRASRLQVCDWGLESEMGPATPIAHVAKARALARLNALAGSRLAAQGKITEALQTWTAGLRFAQHLGQDGTLISVLAAKAALSSDFRAMVNLTSRNPPDAAALTHIGRIARSFPPYPLDWSRAMLTEADAAAIMLKQVAESKEPEKTYELMFGEKKSRDEFKELVKDAPRSRAELQRIFGEAASDFRLPYTQAHPALQNLQRRLKTSTAMSQQVVPNLSRINEERARLETDRAALIALVALQEYRRKNGRVPSSLAGLDAPNDPFSGQPFSLIRVANGWELRSVGMDKNDSLLTYHLRD